MLKSYRVGWGGVGGPCDFSVSPSPFGLDFGTLDFGTSDLGLTKRTFLKLLLEPRRVKLVDKSKQNICSSTPVIKKHLLHLGHYNMYICLLMLKIVLLLLLLIIHLFSSLILVT